jgi:hypothetical protein
MASWILHLGIGRFKMSGVRTSVRDIPAAGIAAAWVLTGAWFVLLVSASEGFLPGAALLWSAPALLLAWTTRSWLGRHRSPLSRRELVLVGGVWLLILLTIVPLWLDGAVPDGYEWFVHEISPLYAVFPLALTAAATMRILRTPGRCPPPNE